MKKTGIVAFLGIVAGLWAMGCSNPAGVTNGGGGSCDLKTAAYHECESYSAAQNVCALGVCSGETACKDSGGTWGSSCPSAGSVGTCTTSSYSITYYSDNGFTKMSAQQACTAQGGTFM